MSRQSRIRALLVGSAVLCGIVVFAVSGGFATNTDTQPGRLTPREREPDKVQVGPVVSQGRSTPASNDDLNHSTGTAFNPCKLVSLSDARTIIGGAISAQVEAPLGPTCIFKRADAKGEITVTVESGSLPHFKRQMRALQSLTVGNRRGYCGRLGAEMLFVPLGNGRLLHITAPCSLAQQFATRALRRITA